ncbi:MAG TPA: condensation domain-containing protein, partial [Thermoanaerobaculia bacterium]|nr:condensation domain-containing protein [Thermoanaerobaculia bacterium]
MSESLSPLAGISPERRRLLLQRLGIRPGAAVRGAVIPRAPRDGELPLSFAQQRLWLLHQLEPRSPAYNVPFAVRFEGGLSPALTAWAMTEIVRRHEALRTTFGARDGEPRQVIGAAAPVPAPVVELSALPAAARERESARLAAAEARRPFDVERGPLLRVLLLRQGTAEHLALLTMHHLVSDGWSMGLLVEEFCSLYAAGAAGRPPDLPELAIQYADYACWQRRQLRDGAFATGLEYWRQRL